MSLILQAENEYHDAIKKAVREAEKYTDDCRNRQRAYIEELNREWELLEKAEQEKLEKALLEAEKKMEKETAQTKARLKSYQEKKVDTISERLKEEVVSIYGYR